MNKNFKINFYKVKGKNISIVGGVLSGISYEYGFPTWKIRLPFLMLFMFYYTMPYIVLIYMLAWFFLDKKNVDENDFFIKTKQSEKIKK